MISDWKGRFEAFAERKASEAAGAALAPFTTSAERADSAFDAIGNDWSRTLFDGSFYLSPPPSPDLPATSLVFVQSRDGNTGARDPALLGGGDIDRHLIYEGLSRVAADAVLAGAGTVRGGHFLLSTWHPELVALRAALGLPRHPTHIVATLSGLQLDEALLFNVPDVNVILITVAAAVDVMSDALATRPWMTPLVMNHAGALPEMFRRLRQLGLRRISCIGGRTLARSAIEGGLIQDVYLTTGTATGGEPNTPLDSRALAGREVVRKIGTGADAGVLFQHLVIQPT